MQHGSRHRAARQQAPGSTAAGTEDDEDDEEEVRRSEEELVVELEEELVELEEHAAAAALVSKIVGDLSVRGGELRDLVELEEEVRRSASGVLDGAGEAEGGAGTG